MSRSGEDFIQKTGGFRIDDPMTFSPAHGKRIQELEDKLKSGTLSAEEVDKVHQMICDLKGLPPDEWDYEPPED